MTSDDLKNYIASLVSGEYFVGYLPPTPDTVIMMRLYGGVPDDDLVQMRCPKFQILVRDTSYQSGESKIESIFEALHHKYSVQIGGRFVYSILALQEPMYIGTDKTNRHEFSVNFQITSAE